MTRTGRASAIIIKNNEILLIHRKKNSKEYWVLPGGGIEERETGEEAMMREIKEETNLEAESLKKITTDDNWGEVYLCEVGDGELVLGGPEKEDMTESNWFHPEWIDLSEKKKLVLFEHLLREI